MKFTWLPNELRPLRKHLAEGHPCVGRADGSYWVTNGHWMVRAPRAFAPPTGLRLIRNLEDTFDPLGRRFENDREIVPYVNEDLYLFGDAKVGVNRDYVDAIEACRFADPQRVHWAIGGEYDSVFGYVGATSMRLTLIAVVMPVNWRTVTR